MHVADSRRRRAPTATFYYAPGAYAPGAGAQESTAGLSLSGDPFRRWDPPLSSALTLPDVALAGKEVGTGGDLRGRRDVAACCPSTRRSTRRD